MTPKTNAPAHATKMGPPKLYPIRLNLRISAVEVNALNRIRAATAEDKSEIVRRLIREADPSDTQKGQ